jgi:hypothetical protein
MSAERTLELIIPYYKFVDYICSTKRVYNRLTKKRKTNESIYNK